MIIFFSGHGSASGSLVFADSENLETSELREIIESFPNDTVLIIDACYSGNNEGPLDIMVSEESFRDNCLRIYASLAHLAAKEVTYDNPFFGQVLPFYRNTLLLENVEGNGYFTALIGMFFAQYRFQKEENISYRDIVYYVTNKAKIYVENLAKTKGPERKGAWEEAVYRLNQLPNIHPVDKKISFEDANHEFMLLRKLLVKYRPQKEHVSIDYDAAVSLTLPPYNESLGPGIMPEASLMYNFAFDWGIFGLGLRTGVGWSATHTGDYPFYLLIYPLAIRAKYCTNLASPFYIALELAAGAGFTQLVFMNESDAPKNAMDIKFYWRMGIGFGLNLSRDLGLAISIGYTQLYPHSNLFHILTPGISVIHNISGTKK